MNLIEHNDREQSLKCTQCSKKRFVDRRDWICPERKLSIIERFKELHADCVAQVEAALRIKFFARPFRANAIAGSVQRNKLIGGS
jgi:hypothetical protein